ncbi:hypothetical protein H6503_06680 [Candidatus Woesearchaeota archaeon]|nr:hypothetical protein [Candidatus Woesearchaeota archaeon]
MHRIRNFTRDVEKAWRRKPRLRIIVISVIIVIAIILLSMTFIASQNKFLKYSLKSCYDKTQELTNRTQSIDADVDGDDVLIEYDFEQKCFEKMEIEYEFIGNTIRIYFIPIGMSEGCACFSNFKARAGPIESGEYGVEIYKSTEDDKYLVNSFNVTVKK